MPQIKKITGKCMKCKGRIISTLKDRYAQCKCQYSFIDIKNGGYSYGSGGSVKIDSISHDLS